VETRTRKPTEPTPLLPFRPGRGGKREGAGRPAKNGVAGVSHRERAALASRFPVHVTVKLRGGLPPLRRQAAHAALRNAFHAGCAGVKRDGAFRLCHYAILNDHLHFVAEAHSREALSRGLQGLLVRIAKALNRLWSRRGKVFADRYHDRILRTPREVRNAIRYVFQNARKHAAAGREVAVPAAIDTFTSAPWFDGFRETITVRGLEAVVRPVTDAHTWLLTLGWRRHGLLSVHELPATG
jgi:REP element-mobilizing transposase RayT